MRKFFLAVLLVLAMALATQAATEFVLCHDRRLKCSKVKKCKGKSKGKLCKPNTKAPKIKKTIWITTNWPKNNKSEKETQVIVIPETSPQSDGITETATNQNQQPDRIRQYSPSSGSYPPIVRRSFSSSCSTTTTTRTTAPTSTPKSTVTIDNTSI